MNLLERETQLEVLDRCLKEARAGSGKLVFATGEAGYGKSALVEHFISESRIDARVLWGACDALTTPRALGPVYEIAAQTSLAQGSIPLANRSRDWLFGALFEEFLPSKSTTVVVLEDVHWADESTLDFIRFIGRRIQRTGILLIATYRDEELSPLHPVRLALAELSGRQVVRLRLFPLSLTAVGALADSAGRDPQRLHEITGGNPFFVREVLASTGERVPETVRDAVLARLMRCSQATREFAELVCISPGKTERWLIESVIGGPESAIEEGVARGLFSTQSDVVSSRHELARLAVRTTLSSESTRSMHARVLSALIERGADFPALVHHATLADDAAAVLRYAPSAATEAARLGAHREAVAHLCAALRHGELLSPDSRADLLERHAQECSLTNQHAAAIDSANRARELWREGGNVEAESRVLSFLAPEYRNTGENARADDAVARAVALLEPLPASVHLARAYATRSRLASHRGLDKEAVEFGQQALELALRFEDSAIESFALNSIGATLLIAGDRAGYDFLERSLAVALEKKLEDCAARAYCNLVFCATLGHEYLRTEQFLRDGVAYCEERGLFSSVAYLQAYGSRLALDRGDWGEAARIALQLSQTAGVVPIQRVPANITLALVRMRRGDPGSEELLGGVYDLALSMGEPERIGRLSAARAEQAWYRGDFERVARETAIGLDHLGERRIPWIRGELLFWQSREHGARTKSPDVSQPYRLMLAGDWLTAAELWESRGMPYERALCLAEGPEDSMLRSLELLAKLGARPLETIVRRRLRERGVRGVPRGPRATTRANSAGLSAAESEVLGLLMEGCSNAQIAHRLVRSTRTIDHHVSAVLGKLGVRSRAEAIAMTAAPDKDNDPDGAPETRRRFR